MIVFFYDDDVNDDVNNHLDVDVNDDVNDDDNYVVNDDRKKVYIDVDDDCHSLFKRYL